MNWKAAVVLRSKPVRKSPFLAVPALGWFLWFLMAPLGIVVFYSFLKKGTYGDVVYEFSLANYARTFDWLYFQIFLNSLKLAALTSLCCLILGYPMAYVMATARPKARSTLLFLLVIPFLTNFVVRAFALKGLLAEEGPLNVFLIGLGWISEPLVLTNSQVSVLFGMVVNYLPFMVLPLYVALEKFDFGLLEAARDLGAPSLHVLFKVLFPLTKQGIVTGVVLVFMPALGEFIIPDLFGGARTMLVGNLITEVFLKARDWPFGSALSVILLLIVLGGFFIQKQMEKERVQS